jgi:hypothetical protein
LSLGALALKGSASTPVMECSVESVSVYDSIHSWPIDPSAEHQHPSCFGSNDEMLLIDRALNASGLIWALKVSLNGSTFLLEIEVLRRSGAVWVIAIQRPLSANVRGRLLSGSLLRPSSQLKDNWKETQTEKTADSLLHFYVHFTLLAYNDYRFRLFEIRRVVVWISNTARS